MDLLQKLLQIDKNDVRNKKKGTYKSGNMQELVGDPMIEIQEIDAERLTELQTLPLNENGTYDYTLSFAANSMTVAEGVVNPDLTNKELQDHFGAQNAAELAKILFKTEIADIAVKIAELSSPEVITDEDVKN